MSQPEEPEFQWLEDVIVHLSGAAFALIAAVITIVGNLVFAIGQALIRRD